MSSPIPPLPNFLIIGAQKCATRWLRFNLGKHPDVFTARRELEFFNHGGRFKSIGSDGYRTLFEGWSGEPFVGEATPGYMIPRHRPGVVATRIKETVPDVRLIALVRNPIDRALSAMVHHIKRGRLPPDLSLLDFVRQTPPEEEWLGLVVGGRYAASLRHYRQLFGDQLLVLVHDDLQEDPRSVYAHALRHIGADADFAPSGLEEVIFSNREGASERLELSIDDRRALYEYFRDDIRKLERMIDRDLSIWRPEGSPAASVRHDRWRSRFSRTTSWVEERVRGVSPDQYDDRTTRTGGSVLEVINGLVQNLHGFVAALQAAEQLQDIEADDARRDPVTAYKAAAGTLRSALAEETTTRGSAEAADDALLSTTVAGFAVVDQLCRGWDLAYATGQDATIPDDLAESAVEFLGQLMPDGPDRTDGVRAASGAGDAATPTERFVASTIGIQFSEQDRDTSA